MKNLFSQIYTISSVKLLKLIDKAKMTEHSFMVIMALIIGTIAGFGAVLIRIMIKTISDISFPGSASLLSNIISAPWYVKILVPGIGGLIVGPLIFFFAREAKGHGVPEVMQAILLKGGVIRPRVAIIKAIASSITIGTGGSVGREGPIVQIGASIGSSIGQFFKVSRNRMNTFVGCGAAAGIAAAFNAPVAGALFAVEIILQDFTFTQFSPIVISSVMATIVSHKFEGDFAAFKIMPQSYQLASSYEIIFYFILAIFTAMAGVLFIKTLYASEDFFDLTFKFPEFLKPAVGGLIIGSVAVFFPEIMGSGYETITSALHGEIIWYMAVMLIFVKIFVTSMSLGSGGSGGIFAPSLFLGAMTGAAFGTIVHNYFPAITSGSGTYAVVAMGGLVAATTHAPITAIIVVFELTKDNNIILPLMITCIISTLIATKFSRESIYTLKLVNRNIHIKDGAEINIMKSIFVKDVYTKDFETIYSNIKFDEVVNKIITGRDPYFPVIDSHKRFQGIISIYDIKEYLYEKDILRDLLIADDISNKTVDAVTIDDTCQEAIDRLSENNLQGIPVIDKKKGNKVLGMIWRKDILDAYNKEIERRDITSSYASKITMKNIDSDVHFFEGYAMTEISVPEKFIGKSIKELNIRAKYGIDILLIRSNSENKSVIKAMPKPEYVFSYNDSIVISGEIGKISSLKNL